MLYNCSARHFVKIETSVISKKKKDGLSKKAIKDVLSCKKMTKILT